MESAIHSRPEAFGRKPSWMVEEMRAEAESIKAAADQTAAQAMGEACRLKEKARKMPRPQETEGKFEVRFAQALIEIMTGRATIAKPDMIRMPEPEKFEPLALVLSSTEQFYYRVTASFCPCQGWYWSNVRYGIGKCRHHTLAFPEIARENCIKIEEMKQDRRERLSAKAGTRPRMKATSSDDPGESLLSKESFKPFLE